MNPFPIGRWTYLIAALAVAGLASAYVLKQRSARYLARGQYYESRWKMSALMLQAGESELAMFRDRLGKYKERLALLESAVEMNREGGDQTPRSLAPARLDIKKSQSEVGEMVRKVTLQKARVDHLDMLRQRYAYAAWHPWVSLPPDEPEP